MNSEGKRPIQNTFKLPYIRVNLPSEAHAEKINSRSILIKDVIEEIGSAPSFDTLLSSGLDRSRLTELTDKRFMFKIEGLGRSISRQEQI